MNQDYMRGKLLDYYSTLNVEGKITESEMEDEMDKVSFHMTEQQIERKYKQLKKLKAI